MQKNYFFCYVFEAFQSFREQWVPPVCTQQVCCIYDALTPPLIAKGRRRSYKDREEKSGQSSSLTIGTYV